MITLSHTHKFPNFFTNKRVLMALCSLAVIMLPLVAPFTANAASVYDTVYQTVDEMTLNDDPSYWGDCTEISGINSNWYSLGLNADYVNGGTSSAAKALRDTAYDELNNAIQNDWWWVVSYGTNSAVATEKRNINISFATQDIDMKLVWTPTSVAYQAVNSSDNQYIRTIQLGAYEGTSNQTGQLCKPEVTIHGYGTGSITTVSNNNSMVGSTQFYRNFLVSGSQIDINLPTGYEGIIPRSSYQSLLDDWLNYKIDVADKLITVTPITETMPNVPTCTQYKLVLYKEVDGTPDLETIISQSPSALLDSPMSVTADDYGDYALSITGEIPLICNNPDGYRDDINLVEIVVDGSFYSTSKDQMDCSMFDGVCTVASNMENCLEYGVDLIGGMSCLMRNFFKSLQIFFTSLFVPKPYVAKQIIDSVVAFWSDKLGFLAYPFEFLAQFLGAIKGDGESCSQTFEGNFFGASGISLNFCTVISPQWENLIRLMAQTSAAVIMIFAFKRKWDQVTDK